MNIKPVKDLLRNNIAMTEGQEREWWRRFLKIIEDIEDRQLKEEGEAMQELTTATEPKGWRRAVSNLIRKDSGE